MTKKALITTFCALTLGPWLCASDFSWGFHGGFTSPVGPLRNDSLVGTHETFGGSALGAAFAWKLAGQETLRLRLDLSGITNSSDNRFLVDSSVGYGSLSSSWSIPEVGCDWLHEWSDDGYGWFSAIGLGLAAPKCSLTTSLPYPPSGQNIGSTRDRRQHGKLDARLGGGYIFNKFMYSEISLHHISVDKNGIDGFGLSSMSWFEVALGVRFGAGH